jgi:hypothetical protein
MSPVSGKEYLKQLNHTIKIMIGDWNGDGHNIYETYLIRSNFNKIWMSRAYEAASDELGFCFINEVATEYQNPYAPGYVVAKLREVLEDDNILMDDNMIDTDYRIYSEQYLDIYLRILKFGDPDFRYEFVEHDDQIDIGGYGLFSQ